MARHQSALAGAALAGDQHALAFKNDNLGIADHRSAIVERYRKVDQLHRRVGGLAAGDAVEMVAGLCLLQRVERHHQCGDAARRRIPVGKPRIIVDQPGECRLHDGESRRRCITWQATSSVEKFRRAQDQKG